MIRHTLILGAGRIGAQVGCEWSLNGLEVAFCVRDEERAQAQVEAAFALAVRAGLCSSAKAADEAARIEFVRDVAAAADGRELVLEAVAEDLELKGRLLGAAAAAAPAALLGTSTSSLRVADVGDAAGAPERTVGLHYLNPPLLLPLVEVVGGERTEPDRLDAARELVLATGKTVIEVGRDTPGFAWNRLQLAILRESVALVEEGVVSAADADTIVREGLARRWRHVGPLTTVALGGVETWDEIGRNALAALSEADELPDLGHYLPPIGDPAEATRRRDKGLIADLADEDG